MRVLWIINDVFEPFFSAIKGKPTKGGSWIEPLFFNLAKIDEIDMAVVSPVVDGEFSVKIISEVTYVAIPIKKGDNMKYMSKQLQRYYLKAIEVFNPDIIHVHGTEKNFGLVRSVVDPNIPVVCSIQGIISSYLRYLSLSVANVNYHRYKSVKNRLGRGGIDSFFKRWGRYKEIEAEIFRINSFFIGRTMWDKAHVFALNSSANYFHGEELLRAPFYACKWDLDSVERFSVFISSGAYPIKGLHVLLEAMRLLKSKYPLIKIYCPLLDINFNSSLKTMLFGEDYENYIKSLIVKYNMQNNISFFGRLSAEQMAERFKKSHVFIMPSFIENSPNSLGEAMMIGTPTIVSNTGGIGSMLQDNESSLFFPIGDFEVLAHQLDRLFSDDQLAISLSRKAHLIAQRRHNISNTTEDYWNIYKEVTKHFMYKSERT